MNWGKYSLTLLFKKKKVCPGSGLLRKCSKILTQLFQNSIHQLYIKIATLTFLNSDSRGTHADWYHEVQTMALILNGNSRIEWNWQIDLFKALVVANFLLQRSTKNH